jgi:hypothetical protein
LLRQLLSKSLKRDLRLKDMKNSMIGNTETVSIVVTREDPMSLYHSWVRSGYRPVLKRGTQYKIDYLKLAFARRSRMAVLKNCAMKMLVMMALAS